MLGMIDTVRVDSYQVDCTGFVSALSNGIL